MFNLLDSLLSPQQLRQRAMGGGPGDETPEQQLARVTRNTMPLSMANIHQLPMNSLNMLPPAQAAQMPQSPHIGLLQQLKLDPMGTIGRGFSRLGDAIAPLPPGMEGLLSPAQQAAARKRGLLDFGLSMLANSRGQGYGNAPSFGQALAAGVQAGRQGSAGQITEGLQNQQGALQMAQQLRVMQTRQMMQQLPPLSMNASQDQIAQRVKLMFALATQSGDTEMLGKLSEAMKSFTSSGSGRPITVNAGDRELLVGQDGKPIAEFPKGAPPETAAQAHAAAVADRKTQLAEETRRQGLQRQFLRDPAVQNFAKAKPAWEALLAAIHTPTLLTPAMLMDSFGRINNPGYALQVSQQDAIKGLGSIGDRLRMWMEKNKSGQLPDDIRDDYVQLMYNVMREHLGALEAARDRTLSQAETAGLTGLDTALPQYTIPDPFAGTAREYREGDLRAPDGTINRLPSTGGGHGTLKSKYGGIR
jgi:hypothetical protein